MRNAYAIVGIAGLIVFTGAAYAFNRSFTQQRPAVAGQRDTVSTEQRNDASISMTTSTLTLTSSAFANNDSIPSRFTCDGNRTVSPELIIGGVSLGTKSLALIMDDPDVPKALHADGIFDHWVLFNIPPPPAGGTREIPEGGSAGVAGANGAGKNAYTGPCPPPQYEPSEHRYIFKLYALDSELPLRTGATKDEVEQAMEGHIITQTQLVGRYKRI